jgi:hypothetical protein
VARATSKNESESVVEDWKTLKKYNSRKSMWNIDEKIQEMSWQNVNIAKMIQK